MDGLVTTTRAFRTWRASTPNVTGTRVACTRPFATLSIIEANLSNVKAIITLEGAERAYTNFWMKT